MSKLRRVPLISRPCWDKYHRCPGSNGRGWKFNAPGENWCEGGYVEVPLHRSLTKLVVLPWNGRLVRVGFNLTDWRWGRCNRCGVRVLPRVARLVDPRYWPTRLKSRSMSRRAAREWRRSR